MGFDVRCPACHAHTRVPPEALGRNIRCKKCSHAFLAHSAQGVAKRPPLDEKARSRLLLFVGAGLFVLVVVLLIVLRATGVI